MDKKKKKKKEVEPKLTLLNVTGKAVKAQSYTSILDDRLKILCIILDLSEVSDFSDFPCLWLGICPEEMKLHTNILRKGLLRRK